MNLLVHMDHAAQVATELDRESREIGKLVDGITRIASQTDLLAHRVKAVNHGSMLDLNAFGLTGRARSIDNIR